VTRREGFLGKKRHTNGGRGRGPGDEGSEGIVQLVPPDSGIAGEKRAKGGGGPEVIETVE
jgi:hypothetical protein